MTMSMMASFGQTTSTNTLTNFVHVIILSIVFANEQCAHDTSVTTGILSPNHLNGSVSYQRDSNDATSIATFTFEANWTLYDEPPQGGIITCDWETFDERAATYATCVEGSNDGDPYVCNCTIDLEPKEITDYETVNLLSLKILDDNLLATAEWNCSMLLTYPAFLETFNVVINDSPESNGTVFVGAELKYNFSLLYYPLSRATFDWDLSGFNATVNTTTNTFEHVFSEVGYYVIAVNASNDADNNNNNDNNNDNNNNNNNDEIIRQLILDINVVHAVKNVTFNVSDFHTNIEGTVRVNSTNATELVWIWDETLSSMLNLTERRCSLVEFANCSNYTLSIPVGGVYNVSVTALNQVKNVNFTRHQSVTVVTPPPTPDVVRAVIISTPILVSVIVGSVLLFSFISHRLYIRRRGVEVADFDFGAEPKPKGRTSLFFSGFTASSETNVIGQRTSLLATMRKAISPKKKHFSARQQYDQL